MARPRKTGLDYFPHDTDASSDEKIETLRAVHGNDGYAFYFILLERIYRSENFEIHLDSCEIIRILSNKVGVTEKKFMSMLNTALKFNCFNKELYEEKKLLTSSGIKRRASVVVDKRLKMQEKYGSREKGTIISDAETCPDNEQSKVKQSIEKKSKQKERKASSSDAGIPFETDSTICTEKMREDEEDLSKEVIDYFRKKSGIDVVDGDDCELAGKLVSHIPADTCKAGIDEAFRRFKPKYRDETIKTLRYCQGCIKELWEHRKNKGVFDSGYNNRNHNQDNEYAKRDWSAFLYNGKEGVQVS